jgi:hypothetical protein
MICIEAQGGRTNALLGIAQDIEMAAIRGVEEDMRTESGICAFAVSQERLESLDRPIEAVH